MGSVLRVIGIYLLVALVSGGIAMLGNQLGRRIGRRKMSVFGMRPRHTSIFITTLTGILIALLTLTLAIVASQDIRDLVFATNNRINLLRERERELNSEVRALQREVQKGTIVWNYGERIALGTVPAHSEPEVVARSMRSMLVTANMLSLIKNNRIATTRREEPLETGTVLVEYELDDFQRWVTELSDGEQTVGVWLVVGKNCLYRDQVPVSVEPFPVKKVFSEGEVVCELEVEPGQSLVNWYEFLDRLRYNALRKGMLEMNDSLGGGLTTEQLLTISNKIESRQGSSRLVAIANRDLYESSTLDVRIEVLPADLAASGLHR